MAISRSPSPSTSSPTHRRLKTCARRCERLCCTVATYFPLAFVYGLTTWAVSVEASLGIRTTSSSPTVPTSRRLLSFFGVCNYILLNTCYTVAVFTDPGSPLQSLTKDTSGGRYSVLPTTELHEDFRNVQTITVNSTGGSRYCKKCHVPKPDRTHHCSTCKRCVLKMDHHCPWLSTCLGLHNYKAFVLFLLYTSLFCWVCLFSTAWWLWTEVFAGGQYLEEFAPVQVIILAVVAGIIGLVLTGFTGWHLYLCAKGSTTIECLEKTRYLSGVRKRVEQHRRDVKNGMHSRSLSQGGVGEALQRAGGQLLEFHANAVPGASRYEEGEEHTSPVTSVRNQIREHTTPSEGGYGEDILPNDSSPAQQALRRNYGHYEIDRERERYEEYMEDRDSTKMPNAFDLGWKRNLAHLFGPNPWLRWLPVCNTTGDGWRWEVSQEWQHAQEEASRRKEARIQMARERGEAYVVPLHQPITGAGRHYADGGYQSQARDQDQYGQSDVSMQTMPKIPRRGKRHRRDFDRTGEDGEVDSFEVSDSMSDNPSESEDDFDQRRRDWRDR